MTFLIADYRPRLIGYGLDAILCRAKCPAQTPEARMDRYRDGALLFVGWEQHAVRAHAGAHLQNNWFHDPRWRMDFYKKKEAESATILPLKRAVK